MLEWLPQESLLFDGARAAIDAAIELAAGARFIGWDIVGLGRTASGERFASGSFVRRVELVRDGALVWCERAVLEGGSTALQSGAVLAGAPVFGTMIVAGAVDRRRVARGVPRASARAEWRARGDAPAAACSLRAIAATRAVEARTHILLRCGALLRPALVGRAAVPPRIWST